MRVIVSGGSGLIGTALIRELGAAGHDLTQLVRDRPVDGRIVWNPLEGRLDASAINGADVLVHLSGEGVASGRWTAAKKQSIRDSRVKSTKLLADTIRRVENPPATWLCASAIGYYGNRGDDWIEEDSAPGTGFLADVCREWEEAAASAADAGVRVVNLRFAVVLSPDGGAFRQMMTAFKLGAGGVIGSGKQYISWITLEDAVRAVLHVLENPFVSGPVNLSSPNPVTNRELTKALGRALRRPTILPLPAALARLVFGEMADEMFLASTRVRPRKLVESGFSFNQPNLDAALHAMLSDRR